MVISFQILIFFSDIPHIHQMHNGSLSQFKSTQYTYWFKRNWIAKIELLSNWFNKMATTWIFLATSSKALATEAFCTFTLQYKSWLWNQSQPARFHWCKPASPQAKCSTSCAKTYFTSYLANLMLRERFIQYTSK